jgi:serine/threonine-protein kinase HipA
MTLLGKTDGASAEDGVSYLDIASLLKSHGANPKADLVELWKRIVFNMCVSNTDDHLRNHAFLLTMSGWSLSPMFDVNPEPTGDELSLNVDETDNRIRIELAISVAERFGIPKKEAEDIAYDIRKTVADRWKYLAKSCGLSRGQIEAMAPAFTEDYCNQKAYS